MRYTGSQYLPALHTFSESYWSACFPRMRDEIKKIRKPGYQDYSNTGERWRDFPQWQGRKARGSQVCSSPRKHLVHMGADRGRALGVISFVKNNWEEFTICQVCRGRIGAVRPFWFQTHYVTMPQVYVLIFLDFKTLFFAKRRQA